MSLLLLTNGSVKAEITASDRTGYYYVSSRNIYEIATMKAERDFYRDELEKAYNHIPLGINFGLGSKNGAYAEIEYKIKL